MRVRVEYSVTVNNDFRMALRHSWGECGTLATRSEVRDAFEMTGRNDDADLMQEWQDCDDCQRAAALREAR
jgi:hypothetical protein